MLDRDPTSFGLITYGWVLALSLMGGLVSFIRQCFKTRDKLPLRITLIWLVCELTISAFAGVVTFYLCEYWELDGLLTAVMVAVSGHLGGSAIDKIIRIWDAVTNKSI